MGIVVTNKERKTHRAKPSAVRAKAIQAPTEEERTLLLSAMEGLDVAINRLAARMDESHDLLQDCVQILKEINATPMAGTPIL